MFLDLDDFKPVNDKLGHDSGDFLLQSVATRLRRSLRESDTMAIAKKICRRMSMPFEVKGHSIAISASIGIAMYPDHGERELEPLKHADEAMYEAKQNGRNQARMCARA
ncbi:MAG: GGDEF domain-containing protein [Proteobacteria bacterium]|nr:GGDEF domain-containing protein [Pseudomonadota bacterium]